MKLLKPFLFLLVLILSQSCVVYQKTSVSLDKAYDRGNVRIITNSGKQFDFKHVILENGIYYGVSHKTEIADVELKPNSLASVFLQNRPKSLFLTSLVLAPNIAVVIFSIVSLRD